ncbi:MAG TPA: hypothetical protein PLP17_15380 [Oligoflexia bacterium]|nr:hypothetical protein [Oligoflexia bacterium]
MFCGGLPQRKYGTRQAPKAEARKMITFLGFRLACVCLVFACKFSRGAAKNVLAMRNFARVPNGIAEDVMTQTGQANPAKYAVFWFCGACMLGMMLTFALAVLDRALYDAQPEFVDSSAERANRRAVNSLPQTIRDVRQDGRFGAAVSELRSAAHAGAKLNKEEAQ